MNYQQIETEPSGVLSKIGIAIRILFGVALTLGGSYVVVTVLLKIRSIFDNPEALGIFLKLVPQDPALRKLIYDGQEIILPLATFDFVSYGVAVSLLFIAGLLGASILKQGIYLLVP